jgi:hypothetical protein
MQGFFVSLELLMKHSLLILGTVVASLSLAAAANAECGLYYSCQEAINQPVVDWGEYHESQTDSLRRAVDEFERSWD